MDLIVVIKHIVPVVYKLLHMTIKSRHFKQNN